MLFPPYSMMMWDERYRAGTAEELFYTLEAVMPVLLAQDNVTVYYFQSDSDMICNLDNYMDVLHYSPGINQMMLECLGTEQYLVTKDNMTETIEGMRDTYTYLIHEGMDQYYE